MLVSASVHPHLRTSPASSPSPRSVFARFSRGRVSPSFSPPATTLGLARARAATPRRKHHARLDDDFSTTTSAAASRFAPSRRALHQRLAAVDEAGTTSTADDAPRRPDTTAENVNALIADAGGVDAPLLAASANRFCDNLRAEIRASKCQTPFQNPFIVVCFFYSSTVLL